MDRRIKDLTGKRFGRLVVQSYSHTINHRTYWNCLCDCGKTKTVFITCLTQNRTNSCGCIQIEFNKNKRTHGDSVGGKITAEYRAWVNMKVRCYNPNGKWYKNYGARGIKVCKRWLASFENFLSDMGRKPSPKHSLDRIKTNKNYYKSNCRWATVQEQSENKRTNVFITYKGQRFTQVAFCRLIGKDRCVLMNKLSSGMTIDEIANYYLN